MNLQETFNTMKPKFDKELEGFFPHSRLETGFTEETGISITGTLILNELYLFLFREKWILDALGPWMPENWRKGHMNPDYLWPHGAGITVHATEAEVATSFGENRYKNIYIENFINITRAAIAAFVNRYKNLLVQNASLQEQDASPKYLLIVTCEPGDDEEKRLDYYSDNPWEGLLQGVLHFNTLEEISEILAEYEGQFYQLFEMEHGCRLGYGMICDEYPESDIFQYEDSLLTDIPEEETVSDDADSTGQLIVLSGFSRAGKDTVAAGLKQLSSNYVSSVSVTTRTPRAGERNEVDYYFVTEAQFQEMKKQGAFLEYAKYCGHDYGTPVLPVQKALLEGKDVILVLETDGAMKIKDLFPQALTFFVAASATDILKRMEKEPVSDKEQRISQMRKEISTIPKYDYLVMNGDGMIDQSISLIHGIVTGSKRKTAARLDTIEQLRKEFENMQVLSGAEQETPILAPCVVRKEDNAIFHIGDKVIHFKWELNRDRDIQNYMYEITGFPRNTETEEEYVAYRSVSHPDKEWIRPYTNFIGEVDHMRYPDVKQKYRFAKLD